MSITETKDRKARRSERSATDALRRKLKVSYEELAARVRQSGKAVWDKLSDKSVLATPMKSEVDELRSALNEIAKERER